jgi:hypothetical protein
MTWRHRLTDSDLTPIEKHTLRDQGRFGEDQQ